MANINKKRGLGRGLEALIPQISHINDIEEKVSDNMVELISINKIYPNKNQPRKDFERETLLELAESIKKHGIIQPVIVLKKEEGYMIIAGERRWRAAREAMLTEVPCIVKNYDEKQLMEVALIENIQREDLNIIEEALGYKYLIEKYEIKQDQLAIALGKSRPHIANTIRLLQLHPTVLKMIIERRISAGQGRALLGIKDEKKQCELALKIEEQQLNVRQVELLVKAMTSPGNKEPKVKKEKELILREIENNLKVQLGTKVNIIKGNKRGKIEIEYYSEDEFERILEILQSSH